MVLDQHRRRPDRGLGMWGRSQAVLRELGLGTFLDGCHRIPSAAYRSRDGAWLSRCSDTPANRVRVATLREAALLEELEAGLPEGSVRRNAWVYQVSQDDAGIEVRLDDGTSERGAVLVGADGANSAVRRLHFGGSEPFGPWAVDTGMVSYSGVLSPLAVRNLTTSGGSTDLPAAAGSPVEYAFETLSAGRRFAMVPLADGGAFWFATLPAASTPPGDAAGAAAVAALRAAYDGWHAPIPRVLHAVACDAAEAAMATATASLSSSSSTAVSSSPSASPPLRCERLQVAPPLERWWRGRAALVGDAAHALPINLAQGASCAVEGAYTLATSLADALDGDGGGGCGASSPADVESELEAAFARYQDAHAPRVRQCELVTSLTQLLAQPASPATEAVRNAMRLVPPPLNGWVFDLALELSLGDKPARTRALWPLRTTV